MSIITGTSNLGSSSKCDVIPQDGLVVSYLLTGTTEDETGTLDGTENGVTYVYDPERGMVCNTVIDSNRQYISLYGLGNSRFTNTSITISAWIKIDAFNSSGASYISLYSGTTVYTTNSGSSQFNICLNNEESTIGCSFKSPNNTGYGTYNDGGVYPSGFKLHKWYHVVAIYDQINGKLKLYWNTEIKGTLDVATDGLIPGTYAEDSNYIGDHPNSGWETDACYSNVHMYDRVLTDLEITQIYNLEKDVHNIPIDNGLIAYYQLDGNSLDNAISPSYDGTDNGITYVADSSLRGGVCAKFDGTSSTISSSASLNNIFSLSFWIKTIGTVKYSNPILFGALSNGNNLDLAYGRDNGLSGWANGSSGYIDITSSIADEYKWNHLSLTYDGTTLIAYTNGVQAGTYSGSVVINPNMYLSSPQQSNTLFNGEISNLRIYDRALSQIEIDAIYKYEKPDSEVCLTEFKRGLTAYTHDIFGDGSCIATYQLNGDATDLGGNYDGTATNVTYTDGTFSDAAVFDGNSSKINLIQNYTDTVFTWSFWVKFNRMPTTTNWDADYQQICIIANDDGTEGYSYDIRAKGQNLEFVLVTYGGAIADNMISSTNLVKDTWYNIVIIYDDNSTEAKLYLDNSLDCSKILNNSNSNPPSSILKLGNRGDGLALIDGLIDQVRIFNRALTEDEIAQLYRENNLGV